MDDRQARTMAAYETAIEAMPPLTRVVYLMQRVKDLPYDEIAARLEIDGDTVVHCMACALATVAMMMDGRSDSISAEAMAAEAAMARRYRDYCASVVRSMGPLDISGADHSGEAAPHSFWSALVGAACAALLRLFERRTTFKAAFSYDEWLRREATRRPVAG